MDFPNNFNQKNNQMNFQNLQNQMNNMNLNNIKAFDNQNKQNINLNRNNLDQFKKYNFNLNNMNPIQNNNNNFYNLNNNINNMNNFNSDNINNLNQNMNNINKDINNISMNNNNINNNMNKMNNCNNIAVANDNFQMMPNLNFMNNQMNNIPQNLNNIINLNFNNNFENSNKILNEENSIKMEFPNGINLIEFTKVLGPMKNCLCKIGTYSNTISFGFFCRFGYKNKRFKILITEYLGNIMEYHDLHFKIGKKEKSIYLDINRLIFYNEKYNITIFEIKDDDDINYFLEFDNKLLEEENNQQNLEKKINSIYFLFLKSGEIKFCFGNLKGINDFKMDISFYNFQFEENIPFFYTISEIDEKNKAKAFPILDLKNNKLIGKLSSSGSSIFLKFPLMEYLQYYSYNKNVIKDINPKKLNQIKLRIEVNEDEINKRIYFFNNYENDENDKTYMNNELNALNQNNVNLFIDEVQFVYKKYFRPTKEGIYFIKLFINANLNNCFAMFYNCKNLIEIDLSCFNRNIVTNMNYMFYGCNKLKVLDLSNFNTSYVTTMEAIFTRNDDLTSICDLYLTYFDTRNVVNMKNLFACPINFMNICLPFLDTRNVTNMEGLFSGCTIPYLDLSILNTKNVTIMKFMFSGCKIDKLILASNFNTENVIDMESMFSYSQINSLDLSKFNTKNVTNMKNMFSYFKGDKLSFPQNFRTDNVIDMSGMFSGSSLKNS